MILYFGPNLGVRFVCNDCTEQHHEVCIERNRDKEVPDCDCQHKRIYL